MTRLRLIFVPQGPSDPPAYLLANEIGEIVGRGEQAVCVEPPSAPTRFVLVAPGADVAARWVDLPARSEAQARAAALMLLQDEQAVEGEALHVALGPPDGAGRRLSLSVGDGRMRAWLDLARTYGFEPDAVIPDFMLLPQPQDGVVRGAQFGGAVVVRGHDLAFSAEPDLALAVLAGREVAMLDPEEAERLAAACAAAPDIDLLQGPFAAGAQDRPRLREYRRAAVLAAALVLSVPLLDAAQALRLNLAAGKLERGARTELSAVLPKGAPSDEPAAQAQAALARAELASGGGPAGLSAQFFNALSGIDGAQAESLIVSPDGALRASVSHANYSDMELLRDALRGQGLGFREDASREADGRIVSDIIIGARP